MLRPEAVTKGNKHHGQHSDDLASPELDVERANADGWPAFKPACDSIAFTSGGAMDFTIGMECAKLATAMRKDLVYSCWASVFAKERETYSIVIREMLTVDIIDRCIPFMADDSAPLVLVSTRADEVFAIGRRGLIERIPGKPKGLDAA